MQVLHRFLSDDHFIDHDSKKKGRLAEMRKEGDEADAISFIVFCSFLESGWDDDDRELNLHLCRR